jgi:hypothetical protein
MRQDLRAAVRAGLLLTLAMGMASSSTAQSQPRAPQGILLPEDLIQSTSDVTGIRVVCGYSRGSWTPGALTSSTKLFVSDTNNIKFLQRKLKSATTRTRSKLQKQLTRARSLLRRRSAACALLPMPGEGRSLPSPTPEGTPPQSGPTPTPPPSSSATPTAKTIYIDSNGVVTEEGRALFQIPANLPANRTSGKAVFDDQCAGCHDGSQRRQPTGLTFPTYRTEMARSPMFITSSQVPNSDLAHLTVYLNRFRTQAE